MLDTIIQQKISELPSNIRNAVESFDWATEIVHIAENYHLQIDDIDIFRRETLLVIVGATEALHFEKNLAEHMHISHELAENLVADANEHIFRPLQKIAFTHHAEPEIIPHDDISSVMDNHGIKLVDEFPTESRPKNELQEMADSLFQKEENSHEIDTSPAVKEETIKNKKVEYNEPITESDLVGIHEHRIDTHIIHKQDDELSEKSPLFKNLAKSENILQSLDKKILETPHISKNEKFDVSPSLAEQVIENGDFLKHIGAS